MKLESVTMRRVSDVMGAEVLHIDLARAVESDPAQLAGFIRKGLAEHVVLFFPNQILTDAHLTTLIGLTGGKPGHHIDGKTADNYPFVNEIRAEATTVPLRGIWHTDSSMFELPALAVLLYGRRIPDYGGDTVFSNMYMAYDRLSDTFRNKIDDLKLVHVLPVADYTARVNKRTDRNAFKGDYGKFKAEHALVRTNPDSGRRALYLCPYAVQQVVGMTEEESRALLDFIHRHATRPEFQLRHRWTTNELVIWDNRCSIHYAVGDTLGQTRALARAWSEEPHPV